MDLGHEFNGSLLLRDTCKFPDCTISARQTGTNGESRILQSRDPPRKRVSLTFLSRRRQLLSADEKECYRAVSVRAISLTSRYVVLRTFARLTWSNVPRAFFHLAALVFYSFAVVSQFSAPFLLVLPST